MSNVNDITNNPIISMRQKTDTTNNWNQKLTNGKKLSNEFIPGKGEIVFYQDGEWTSIKIGDGITTLDKLPFFGSSLIRQGSVPTAMMISGNSSTPSAATGAYSFTEGQGTVATGYTSHAEGYNTEAKHACAHAEGNETSALGAGSHTEGNLSKAEGDYSHAEGNETRTGSANAHAEGHITLAGGAQSHAEGESTAASGDQSHSEGYHTKAIGTQSHAEGSNAEAHGLHSHAEGYKTLAQGTSSHAEGSNTLASGSYGAHSEGGQSEARGHSSHAEGGHWKHFDNPNDDSTLSSMGGAGTLASGNASHSEGIYTIAEGVASHASGITSIASGKGSFAHGTLAITNLANANNIQITINESDQGIFALGGNQLVVGDIILLESIETINGQPIINNLIYEISNKDNNFNYYFEKASSILPKYRYKLYKLTPTKALADGSVAIGQGLLTSKNLKNQIVLGQYNTQSDSLFVIGGGNFSERKNIFEITEEEIKGPNGNILATQNYVDGQVAGGIQNANSVTLEVHYKDSEGETGIQTYDLIYREASN